MKRLTLYLVMPLVLAGCSMAPNYERPNLPTENIFPTEDALSGPYNQAYKTGWREYFKDPRMQQYIGLALENNRDLRVALLRVEEARLGYAIAQRERLPDFDASGSKSRSMAQHSIGNNYNVGFGISQFELDLWGRVKSLSDSALNKYLATVEGQKSAHIALIAQVARSYVDQRVSEEQLKLARETLNTYNGSYNLIRQQVEAGIANDLDLAQAQAQVHTARVEVARAERQVLVYGNVLTELAGIKPVVLAPALAVSNQSILGKLPAGLPSEVLLVHPSVMAAEFSLKSANADIGAARAAFFPRIALTTTTGSISPHFSKLFDADSETWNFTPTISMPIFHWLKNKGNLDLAHVRKSIEIANYEKAIQTAFRDVANGLVSRQPLERQLAAQRNLVSTNQERLRLANLLYTNGIASYLDVLDAERSLFSARQALLNTYQEQIKNGIDLYVALGGGLNERTEAELIVK